MLFFTGDINLTDWYFNAGFGIGTGIANGFNPFQHIKRNPEEVWIGNFEGVASSLSTKTGFSSKVFRVEPTALSKLNHFELYGLANNHAMQHGDEAYLQTVDSIESFGTKCFGSKKQKTILIEHQGQKVSITGMSLRIDEFSECPLYWHNPEYDDILTELQLIPEDTFKVLYVHWGNEYINRPSSAQKKFAHWLIDAGFDLIIGMHPHVLQGFEIYKGKHIFYSLGNFVFEMAWTPTKIGAVVELDLTTKSPSVHYVKIGSDSAPRIVDESCIPTEWRFEYLNEALRKEDNSEHYHAEISKNYSMYRRANHKYILGNILKHPSLGITLINDFVKRRILK